jgi:hypothetical protein
MNSTYIADRLLLNIVGLGLTTWFISKALSLHLYASSTIKQRTWIGLGVATGLILVLVAAYAFEGLVLKPAFDYFRPTVSAGDTFVMTWLRHNVGGDTYSTPSGAVFRQMILLWCVVAYSSRRDREGHWRMTPHAFVVLTLSVILAAILSFVSVYRGIHRPLDVGLAIACSFFFFVAGYYVCSFALGAGRRELSRLVVAVLLTISPILFFYSGSAVEWTAIILIVIGLVAVPDFLPSWKRPEDTVKHVS